MALNCNVGVNVGTGAVTESVYLVTEKTIYIYISGITAFIIHSKDHHTCNLTLTY